MFFEVIRDTVCEEAAMLAKDTEAMDRWNSGGLWSRKHSRCGDVCVSHVDVNSSSQEEPVRALNPLQGPLLSLQ